MLNAQLDSTHEAQAIRRFVTRMYEENPDVPTIREYGDFHGQPPRGRFSYAAYSDGSARKNNTSPTREEAFYAEMKKWFRSAPKPESKP